MDNNKKITDIMGKHHNGRPAYWKGNPHKDALEIYCRHFNASSEEELSIMLGDDLRWRHAEESYLHPEGKPIFDITLGVEKKSHGQPGYFADCTDVVKVDQFPWPDTAYLDFTEYKKKAIRAHEEGLAFFGGFWSPYFHNVADFFGMENYFIKMYENPDVVEAVTERVLDFYCEANRMVLDEMGDLIDVFFFGNDFGTQLDLFMSPAMFERFVLPGIKRLVDTVKKYGKPVMLHSCGSIVKAIPMIIEAGVDGIHPVQAGAVGMEAEKLAPEYGADLAFMGGVDTQNLLPFGSPDDVAGEVERLMGVFGPNYIISPSHEALLANVSPENLIAMSTAAKGKTTAGS